MVRIEEQEQVQQMTINGSAQNLVSKFCIISCSKCGAIIGQVGASRVDVIKSLNNDNNKPLYCSMCGTKLEYPEIIDIKCD